MSTRKFRAAVLSGIRTPFVKSFGVYERETPLHLSLKVASEAVARSGVPASDIEDVIWGAVIPQAKNPNIARDLILFAGLPNSIAGCTINRACASSLQSAQFASDSIQLGRAQVVLAGGVEVLSDVPILYSDEARRFLTRMSRAKTIGEKLSLISKLNPKSFLPKPPGLTEPFTGYSMGEHGEQMAVKNNISRERQDEFAALSHQRAANAFASGYLAEEVVPYFTQKGEVVEKDNIVRADTTLDSLSKLRPAFDKRNGTLTPGNSSALTDGAAALIIASEDYCIKNRKKPMGYVIDSCVVAVNPKDQLLIGPAIAIPKLLMKHGLGIADIGVFEIHEAFAAQVLSCLDSMNSREFCKLHLDSNDTFGLVPMDKLNIDGGSLAYGHPFGATGARLISRALSIAKRKQQRYAVIGICAAGGIAQAMLLETNLSNEDAP